MKYCYIFSLFLICAIFHFNGCSSSTGNKRNNTIPLVPSGVEIYYTGNAEVKLIWDEVSDSDLKGYNVYWIVGEDIDPMSNADSLFTTTNSVTITSLNTNILYTFGISSVDNSGNESELKKIDGKPFRKDSPESPTNLLVVAENIESPQIILSWSANTEPDLDFYRIYRSHNADDVAYSYSYLNSVTTTSFIDEDVEVGVDYYYRITVVEKGWESESSSVENDRVLPPVVIVSPDKFKYVTSTPEFLWQKSEGALNYKIVVKTSRIGGEIWSAIISKSQTNIVYSGETELIKGNTYYWEVGAISKTEINSMSKVGSFVVENVD
ncbi:fibronectin type III domain-containing protein [Candidatus Latescibacterota bacterium]